MSRLITVAIHTYDKAVALRTLLEGEGIAVELQNVNLETPGIFSGVRVRIQESDLPLALRIIENKELFVQPQQEGESPHQILVPVDLSEKSFKASIVAANMAADKGAHICFLYSYIDPYIAGKIQLTDNLTYGLGEKGAREQMEENACKLMDNFVERFRIAMKRGDIPVVRYRTKVVEGVPEDAIVDFAKAGLPYMIVMATRGAKRKELEMIGSVTAEVLDEGRFTILSVPEPIEAEKVLHPANILFLSNLDQDDILAMDTVYRVFGHSAACVTIVHIPKRSLYSDSSAGKAMQRLSEYCASNFPKYHFITVPVNPDSGEKEFVRLQDKYGFDLIVVPNRRRNAFSRLFNPGLAHRILFQTDIPMLLIPV